MAALAASIGDLSLRPDGSQPVGQCRLLPIRHFCRQLRIRFDGECGLIEQIVISRLLRRQSFLQEPLDEPAALASSDRPLEVSHQIVGKMQEQLRHGSDVDIDMDNVYLFCRG
jgi:hypothetical protein